MKTRQLNLEISESLYQQLEKLAELTEESIDDLAISMIAKNLFASLQNAEDFKKQIDNFSTDEIPKIVDNELSRSNSLPNTILSSFDGFS